MVDEDMCRFCPKDTDDALEAVCCLLSAPQLEKEYELKCALYEIGQILCRNKLHEEQENYLEGLTVSGLRKLSKMIRLEKEGQQE